MRKLQKFNIKPYSPVSYNGFAIHYRDRFFVQPYYDKNSVLYEENNKDERITFTFSKSLKKNKKLIELIRLINWKFIEERN